MNHVAIDLGGIQSQICVRSEGGEIMEEMRRTTASLGRYLAKQPASRVIVETCAEAFAVADQALEAGHEVRVVPATLVKSLGVGSRKTKTDKKDARILSEVSCRIDLPSVHVPSGQARERKTLCGMRERLVDARTSLINCVRGWLRAQAKRPRRGATQSFGCRVRDLGITIPEYVERLLESIDHLSIQIAAADKELRALAQGDPLLKRLMTAPGVGPVTAVRFAAAIDDATRFPNAHAVQSYLGLVPGEHQSSHLRHRLGITKAGCPAVRRALVQAAWTTRRVYRAHPIAAWAERIEHRRGTFVATVAVARKLAGILYAMWRDGTVYDPVRAAR